MCASEIKDGMKAARNLAKRFENAIYVVTVGCSDGELESIIVELQTISSEIRKTGGITRG